MPYYNRDPERDHNFDNHPYIWFRVWGLGCRGGALKGKETWKLDEQWAYIAVQCGFQG